MVWLKITSGSKLPNRVIPVAISFTFGVQDLPENGASNYITLVRYHKRNKVIKRNLGEIDYLALNSSLYVTWVLSSIALYKNTGAKLRAVMLAGLEDLEIDNSHFQRKAIAMLLKIGRIETPWSLGYKGM